jgi:hypothetical protein
LSYQGWVLYAHPFLLGEIMSKISMKGGDEYDALTKARKYYNWSKGQLKKIKRGYNKRFRKAGKRINYE